VILLKNKGTLEGKLAEIGYKPVWSEFPSGPPLLEALNAGAIDFGHAGEAPPIFAQAAAAEFVYVAHEPPAPRGEAILIPKDSPIQSVAELKGKTVAVTKASGSHYLLIAALAKSGLKFNDIRPAYLTPADGRAAFEKGAVDAWVTWDPYVAAVEKQSGARVLASGEGVASYQRYYLASSSFAATRPDVLKLVYAKLKETGEWVKRNPESAAQILAPVWGLDSAIISLANNRRSYEVRPVSSDNLAEEQKIADAFFAERALPKQINSREALIWSPDKHASAQ
ncbi:MAG TPA: aliphatic sulfonate ABC transporter substrate-binding protein, partial [Hyphomicrobium sp.]|nr:aliphatic sulfonate ABC transporter substrate-binding protein [Hyphomicrobium sp.]